MVTVVTGASGYIGSHVVANLLARGEKVRATVRDIADPERVDIYGIFQSLMEVFWR